ncbi:hypothetical protein, partial [Mycoplasma marinum]
LNGFETAAQKAARLHKIKIEAAIPQVTVDMINKAINAKKAHSNTDMATDWTLPDFVDVTVGKGQDAVTVKVQLINYMSDDDGGEIWWTSTVFANETTKSATFSGVLDGFETAKQRADKAIDKVTDDMVNAAINVKKAHSDSDIASKWTLPASVDVTIGTGKAAVVVKVKLAKYVSSDSTGEVLWTGTTSATKTTKTGSVNGALNGFETAAQKAARLLKAKADAALKQVTRDMINKAINTKKPHSNTDIASTWTLPASVDVTVGKGQDAVVVKVALENAGGDDVAGEILWVATTSATGTTNTDGNFGKLSGFETAAQRAARLLKDKTDKAIDEVTEDMVNKAINASKPHSSTDIASTWTLPASVNVTVGKGQDAVVVKVALTKQLGDDDKGEIWWTSTVSATGTKKASSLVGVLNGFENAAQKAARLSKAKAEAAMAKVTADMVNKAINDRKPHSDTDIASKWTLPASVDVTIGTGQDAVVVKVVLTNAGGNDTTGKISWTGATSAAGTTKTGSVTGKLNGFETAAQKAARLLKDKVDAALLKVTTDMVNKAINASKSHSSTDVASTWTLPASVNVTVGTGQDAVVVKVVLKKSGSDNDTGIISWTGATSATGTTKTGFVIGTLSGFETASQNAAKLLKDRADKAIAKITADMVNKAIDAKKSHSSTDIASTWTLPASVNIVVGKGVDQATVVVILTKTGDNDTTGKVSWTGLTLSSGTSNTGSVTGSLNGFENAAQKAARLLKDKADKAIGEVTEDMINKAINAKKSHSNTDTASTWTLPSLVNVVVGTGKDKTTVGVMLTKTGGDDSVGIISWTGHAFSSGTSNTHSITGSLNGFETASQNAARLLKAKADAALAKVTASMVNDAINARKSHSSANVASTWTLPNSVNVTVINVKVGTGQDAFLVKVALTKTKSDDATGIISWTGVTSAAGTTKTGSVTGSLGGFEVASQKAARLLKDKADAALPQVTADMVNKAINASKPHSSTDIASTWTLPGSVNVTIGTGQDAVVVKVALTKGSGKDDTGEISWIGITSATGTTNTGSVNGKLNGFETAAQKAARLLKAKADAALPQVTVDMINAAIDASKPHTIADTASTWTLPSSVNVTVGTGQDATTVKVALTKTGSNDSTGAIWWTGATSATGTTKTGSINGISTGFETSASKADKIAKKKADDALAQITADMVNKAIKVQSPFDDTTDPGTWTLPNSVNVTIGAGQNATTINVALKRTQFNNDTGEVSWSGTGTTIGTTNTRNITGTLSGFETTVLKQNRIAQKQFDDKAKAALSKVTTDMINAAIKKDSPYNQTTSVNNWTMPKSVNITIGKGQDAIVVNVKLNPGNKDNNAGTQLWGANAHVVGSSEKRNLFGSATGFETQAMRLQKQRDQIAQAALAQVTADMINNAIKRDSPYDQTTDVSGWIMPRSVNITVPNGQTVTVSLTPGTKDENAGSQAWSAVVSLYGSNKTRNISGISTGFETQGSRLDQLAQAALAQVTANMINAAIKRDSPYNQTTDVRGWTMPRSVNVTVPTGQTITISLTPGAKNDNYGSQAWSAVASLSGSNQTRNISGIAAGFETQGSRIDQLAQAALAQVTEDMINAAIKIYSPYNPSTDVRYWTMPRSVNVTVPNGQTVIVTLTPGAKNANAGSQAWSANVMLYGSNRTRNISGSISGFKTQNSRLDQLARIAISKVTADMVNNAIKTKSYFNNNTNVNNWRMPSFVVVDPDGSGTNVRVNLTPGSRNSNAGSFNWSATTSIAGSSAYGQVSGVLSGFSGNSTQPPHGRLSPQEIVHAIIETIDADNVNFWIQNSVNKSSVTASQVRQRLNMAKASTIIASPFDIVNGTPGRQQILLNLNQNTFSFRIVSWNANDSAGSISWNIEVTSNTTGEKKTVTGTTSGFLTSPAPSAYSEKVSKLNARILDVDDVYSFHRK